MILRETAAAHAGEGIGRIAIGIDFAAVELRPLVLVGQQVIGIGDLAEAFGRLRIVLVAVWVQLLRQRAISALDVFLGRIAADAERGIGI